MAPLSGAVLPSLDSTRLRRDGRVVGICTLQSVACGSSAAATQKKKRKSSDLHPGQRTMDAFWTLPTASGNRRAEGDFPPSASPIDTRPKKRALVTDPNALRSALRRHRLKSVNTLSGDGVTEP